MHTTAMKLDWYWTQPKEKISRLVASQAIKYLTEHSFNSDDSKFYFREFRDGFYYDAQNDLWMLEFAGKTKCLTDGDWVFLSSNTNVIHENPEALPLREVERIALRMITIATD
ncbi:hypothetical protein [Acinetobacter baumannii]|uniref:hypothetical protein n=1 Tax=Acinetobacter baumannii TaxID=470 RepID=UPI000453081A|nr:hypothetical protein [Acinetobacter baumannii]EXB15685.1 hypothetical protein J513_0438 [Acinetobacter baumannii 1397084]EXB61472.1 hypothetical protein J548_0252 [Acinetobacter baumannii 1465485]EXD11073.1 hypothetical protein J499_1536 [Acinetobacter baumannii 1289546]EXG96296.1 hypothetical protein J650_1263 [Acinetobacter baumannii 1022959]EXR27268.1 hypothetical protein J657_1721 [Acinetobacter baumannii 1266220]